MKKRDTRTTEILSSSLDPSFSLNNGSPKVFCSPKWLAPKGVLLSPFKFSVLQLISRVYWALNMLLTAFWHCSEIFLIAVRSFCPNSRCSGKILAAVPKTGFLAPVCTIFGILIITFFSGVGIREMSCQWKDLKNIYNFTEVKIFEL